MAYSNTRSISINFTMLAALLFLGVLIQSSFITAQWTQTLGWGGAGHGKRSSPQSSVPEESLDFPAQSSNCHPSTFVINTMAMIIKKEKERIQKCKIGLAESQDTAAYFDYVEK